MMPDYSITLCQTFINNFNYCGQDGKRNSSFIWGMFQFFTNSRLTSRLENVANELNQAVKNAMDDTQLTSQQRVEMLSEHIKSAITKLHETRQSFSRIERSSSGPGVTLTKYGEQGWFSNEEIKTPSQPSFFERCLINALEKTIDALGKMILPKTNKKLEKSPINKENYEEARTGYVQLQERLSQSKDVTPYKVKISENSYFR